MDSHLFFGIAHTYYMVMLLYNSYKKDTNEQITYAALLITNGIIGFSK